MNLNIVAPALNNFRHRFLSVQYERGKDYPVTVSARGLSVVARDEESNCRDSSHPSRPQRQNAKTKPVRKSVDSKEAHSEEEFVKILKEVLQAPETVDLLQALIVRSNEMTEGDAEAIGTANADAIEEEGAIADKAD